MEQNRKTPRQRASYKGARITFGGGRAVITCLVRNRSDTGACLVVASPIGVPDTFNLVFDSGETSRMCQVIWRSDKQIGVEFQ